MEPENMDSAETTPPAPAFPYTRRDIYANAMTWLDQAGPDAEEQAFYMADRFTSLGEPNCAKFWTLTAAAVREIQTRQGQQTGLAGLLHQ